MPQNSTESVKEFIDHMKLKDENFFHIEQQDKGMLTVKYLFCTIVKEVFLLLIHHQYLSICATLT